MKRLILEPTPRLMVKEIRSSVQRRARAPKISSSDSDIDTGYRTEMETQTKVLLSLSEPICKRGTCVSTAEGYGKDDVFKGHESQ